MIKQLFHQTMNFETLNKLKFLSEYLIWYNLYIRSSSKWENILMEAATDGKEKPVSFTEVTVWIFSQSNNDFEILRLLELSVLKQKFVPRIYRRIHEFLLWKFLSWNNLNWPITQCNKIILIKKTFSFCFENS